nr:hypothetical protein [uncultured Desulfobacter sp.]
MNKLDIKSLYGLKYNPFLPGIPKHALYSLPGSETFELRIHSMARQGGLCSDYRRTRRGQKQNPA